MHGVAPAHPRAGEGTPHPPPCWERLDWGLLAGATALGAVLRFWGLGFPHRFVFDETYYAKDACLYLGRSLASCQAPHPATASGALGIGPEQSFVHPELGKWLIAAGEKLVGYTSFGWRLMPALFGTGLVVLVFLLGRRLFGRWGGAVGGFLAATDFVLITQSRLAMLDVFLAFFVVLGFFFVALERERVVRQRIASDAAIDVRWRVAIGAALGAASAVKWSGAYALAGAGLLVAAWAFGTARRRGASPVPELAATAAAVGGPAVVVYLLSYGRWFAGHHWSFRVFLTLQHAMESYQAHLSQPHPYQTSAWTWPFAIHPIAYWHLPGNPGAHQILLMPNPLVWFAALPAGAWCLYRALRRHGAAEGIVMTGWLAQYLPWLAVTRPLFFFYLTPVVPFMDLALAGSLVALAATSPSRRRLAAVFLAAVVVVLIYDYPGLVGALHPHLL
ncbi:MAG TPA: phospholipid carrier-dependent glycosyltransferase [Actinomycetota bacterium]|nr:phospholipid carrier-dependent glycosyltransferase [Actinomycetota bacterium]